MPAAMRCPSNLSPITERRLLRRCAAGDERARETLIAAMRPLVGSIARRHARRPEMLADIEQVGMIGLIKAIDRFDLSRDTRLATFAFPTITGEIRRHLRDTSWSAHVPRTVKEVALQLSVVERNLAASLHRQPTTPELAQVLNCSEEMVLQARLALGGYEAASLDGRLEHAGRGTRARGELDPGYVQCEDRAVLREALRVLRPVERQAVELRFTADLTQREIGEALGCSQMQVSRLLTEAVGRLQAVLEPDDARTACQRS